MSSPPDYHAPHASTSRAVDAGVSLASHVPATSSSRSTLGHHPLAALGWPQGPFLIRNQSNRAVLDCRGGKIEEGTELILWPSKEVYVARSGTVQGGKAGELGQTRLQVKGKGVNQVMALDYSGCIVPVADNGRGLHLDVTAVNESPRLMATPLISSKANHARHAPPTFEYSHQHKIIFVRLRHNPLEEEDDGWSELEYILESVPMAPSQVERDRSMGVESPLASLSGWLSQTVLGTQTASQLKPKEEEEDASELQTMGRAQPHAGVDGVLFDMVSESESDDDDSSPSVMRLVRLAAIPPGWQSELQSTLKEAPAATSKEERLRTAQIKRKWLRRQWDILPIDVPVSAPSTDYPGARYRHAQTHGGMSESVDASIDALFDALGSSRSR